MREEPRTGLEDRPRLDPLLREWILRLLSLSAEERGTAVELAEALERAAARAETAGPLVPPMRVKALPTEETVSPLRAVRREPEQTRSPWRALAAVGLGALFAWALLTVSLSSKDGAMDRVTVKKGAQIRFPTQGR